MRERRVFFHPYFVDDVSIGIGIGIIIHIMQFKCKTKFTLFQQQRWIDFEEKKVQRNVIPIEEMKNKKKTFKVNTHTHTHTHKINHIILSV